MLATTRATAPPRNLPEITRGTKVPLRSAHRRHEPCLFIALSSPRPKNLVGTTRKIGTIGIIAIAAPAALGLRAPPRPLGPTQPRPRLKIIVAATSQRIEKIGTWAGPSVTTVTKKAILLTNALSPVSEKTSIGLGNLLVDD